MTSTLDTSAHDVPVVIELDGVHAHIQPGDDLVTGLAAEEVRLPPARQSCDVSIRCEPMQSTEPSCTARPASTLPRASWLDIVATVALSAVRMTHDVATAARNLWTEVEPSNPQPGCELQPNLDGGMQEEGEQRLEVGEEPSLAPEQLCPICFAEQKQFAAECGHMIGINCATAYIRTALGDKTQATRPSALMLTSCRSRTPLLRRILHHRTSHLD